MDSPASWPGGSGRAAAGRQIVLLCDGTNNNLTGGRHDTNVVKLGELFAANSDADQVVLYDPGVGNAGELPGATLWDRFRRWFDRVQGLAFGRGVYENMAECYLFLMRHYRPGDQIYCFGFSRGAFTARSVAGLVNQFGILQPHMESMLPTLLHVYFADRGDRAAFDAITAQIARQFTWADTREVDIHFVGVWDTVASVGLPPFDARFTALPTLEGKRFVHVRQALALDEHRRPFRPRAYAGNNGAFRTASGQTGSLLQLWLPGAHGDVGGGYEPASSVLSDVSLAWLASEAVGCGLRLGGPAQPLNTPERVQQALRGARPDAPKERPARRHSELRETALWALAGMCVRDTQRVVMDDGTSMEITPQAHPAAAALREQLLRQESGPGAAAPGLVWLALLAGMGLYLALGQTLYGAPGQGSLIEDLRVALAHLPDYAAAAGQFQWWQLRGWLDGPMPPQGSVALAQFAAPRWALVWDLGLIACYAVVLSWFCGKAFHRLAGLRQAGDPPRPWLNRLGLSLTLAVFADLAENVLSWGAITLAGQGADVLGWIAQCLVAACSVLKWLGLAGAAGLMLGGVFARVRRPARDEGGGTGAGAPRGAP